MKRFVRISATVLKMLLGMLFFFSAASKMVSVTDFEFYIYSFGIFSLGMCFVIARAAIACELLLGAFLLSNRWHRLTCVANVIVLVGFTIFLSYAHLIGRNDSCHCFGELLPFNPVQSILKNAILLIATLTAWKFADTDWQPRWWLALLMPIVPFFILVHLGFHGQLHMVVWDLYLMTGVMGCMMLIGLFFTFKWWNRWFVLLTLCLAPFVTTALVTTTPDDWSMARMNETFDESLFMAATQPGNALEVLRNDSADTHKLVAFYSIHCQYCQATARKISTVQKKNSLSETAFYNVFLDDGANNAATFYKESQSTPHQEIRISRDLFVGITKGQFPLVLLFDGDSVVSSFSTNVSEKELQDFLPCDTKE